MATPVFIQAVSRTAVLFSNPEAFTKPYVEVKRSFVLARHRVKDFGIVPVDWLVALLFVRYYAGVSPFLGVVGFLVFFGTGDEFAGGHAYVFSVGVTGALVAINSLFLLLVDFCFIP